MFRLLQRLALRPRTGRSATQPRRPRLEALEDRTLLSTGPLAQSVTAPSSTAAQVREVEQPTPATQPAASSPASPTQTASANPGPASSPSSTSAPQQAHDNTAQGGAQTPGPQSSNPPPSSPGSQNSGHNPPTTPNTDHQNDTTQGAFDFRIIGTAGNPPPPGADLLSLMVHPSGQSERGFFVPFLPASVAEATTSSSSHEEVEPSDPSTPTATDTVVEVGLVTLVPAQAAGVARMDGHTVVNAEADTASGLVGAGADLALGEQGWLGPRAQEVIVQAEGEQPTEEGTAPMTSEGLTGPEVADLQVPVLSVGGMEIDGRPVLEQTRAALDHLLALAEAAGPWTWLAGGALLIVAAEAAQRRRRAARLALGAWPEVLAPSGLG